MIPKIIHFTVPKNTTEQQNRAIARAKELHPDWTVKIWQDPVDDSAFRLRSYFEKANSGAQLADLLRLDVIYLYGGIYLDSDVYLQKILDPLIHLENFFCSEDGVNLTNAVFGAKPNCPLIDKLISDLLENEPDWTLPPNRTTGPVFFCRMLRWDRNVKLLPRDTFYPFNWNEQPKAALPTTYGVHEWAGSWLNKEETGQKKRGAKNLSNAKQFLKEVVKRNIVEAIDKLTLRIARKSKAGLSAYTFDRDLIAKTNRGIFLSLPGSDVSLTPEIALNGTYEEAELKFIENTLKGGDFFLDIGCNIGIFSTLAARRVGPFGRVYAIDANPLVLQHLKRSLVMNWIHDRTIVMCNAVGNESKLVQLHFSDERLGDANIGLGTESTFHKSNELLGSLKKIDVQQIRLDDIFPFVQEIKIMKIDVEGFEYSVFEGASNMIKNRCFQYILLELVEEVSGRLHGRNLNAAKNIISNGYAPGWIDDKGVFTKSNSVNEALGHSRNIALARI